MKDKTFEQRLARALAFDPQERTLHALDERVEQALASAQEESEESEESEGGTGATKGSPGLWTE